jgi:phospholipid-transporting ATPase
MRSD